jgi:hypothetical protein
MVKSRHRRYSTALGLLRQRGALTLLRSPAALLRPSREKPLDAMQYALVVVRLL